MLTSFQEIMGGGVEYALHRLWSDQLSESEAAAVQDRARNDPVYQEELERSLEFLAGVEALADDREIRGIARDFRQTLQKRRSRRKLALAMAAGLLVASSAVLVHFSPWNGPADSHLQKYFTRIGEQQTIQLDDGSVITLNTGGQLVVDYSGSQRRVLLERGEAYFEVADDPNRPFSVVLGVRTVTAVGTAFNVRKDPQRYVVAVIEGEVAIHEATGDVSPSTPPVSFYGPGARRVEAGWVVEFDVSSEALRAFRSESIERYQDWRSGMLSFYDEPLYRVVRELNRYSRTKILIEDNSIMELSVFTALRIGEIDSALKGLEEVLPIQVTRHYDRIVITGPAGN